MQSLISTGLRRASAWTRGSVNRKIFIAALTVGGFTLMVKLAAIFKELISAYQFGAGRELDALLIAWALPTFVINVLGGSLQAALVPVYLEVLHKEGQPAASRLIGSLSVVFLLLLVVVSLVLLALAPWLLRGMGMGFTARELVLCQHVFYVLLPIIVFTGMARLYGGVLVSENNFAIATTATIATPLLSIICMLLFTRTIGIYSLALGILLGAMVEGLLLAWILARRNVRLSLRWEGKTPALAQIGTQYLPVIMGSVLMAGTLLTDQAMAGMLPAGGVSALSYANKVPAVILGLTSAAIGTAVLPYFSRMVTAADWVGVRHTFRTYCKLIAVTTIPATIVLIVLSGLIIRHLFERGAFTAADSQIVSWTQIWFLMQIPFYTLGILAVRLISALQANRILMWGSAISLVLNAVLDYVLMQKMGVAGIALSTSLVYIVSFVYLFVMLMRVMRKRMQISA